MPFVQPNVEVRDDLYDKLINTIVRDGQRFLLVLKADGPSNHTVLKGTHANARIEATAEGSRLIGSREGTERRMGDYTLAMGGVFLGPGGASSSLTRLLLAVSALGASYSLVTFTTSDEQDLGNLRSTVTEVANEAQSTLWIILLIILAWFFGRKFLGGR